LWLEKSIGRIFRRDEKKPTSWGGSVEFPSFAGPRGYLICALAARTCRIRCRCRFCGTRGGVIRMRLAQLTTKVEQSGA
jgi:hypothetical protein